ncbi:SDR family oxidoreductase [Bradyrhizobium ontarionense]|uniref:SDR family oxidoreductase n=2 Tax=Bradyrhizobium ontarionense TaxID=2898149 RepID=A0ABY3R5V1_9BRAD|nr:SDR family oxidoreductase [Bradyrhizobium sp. A19]
MSRGFIAELAPADMATCIEINLIGALTSAHVAARGMREAGRGWIWPTEGLGSTGPVLPGSGPYAASKAGATKAFTVLARECRGTGVKVGFLCPTLMPTNLVKPKSDPRDQRRLELTMRLLGETPEHAASWFVPRMLTTRRTGTRLSRTRPLQLAGRALVRSIRSGRDLSLLAQQTVRSR